MSLIDTDFRELMNFENGSIIPGEPKQNNSSKIIFPLFIPALHFVQDGDFPAG